MELAAGRGDIAFGSSVVSGESFLKKPEGKGYAQVGAVGPPRRGRRRRRHRHAQGATATCARRSTPRSKTIKANGTYKELADKYFDFDISGRLIAQPASTCRPAARTGRRRAGSHRR